MLGEPRAARFAKRRRASFVRLFSVFCVLGSTLDNEKKIKMMRIGEIRAGDVLLCYKDAKLDPLRKGITSVTGSKYTHAAICISSGRAAEATVSGGASKVQIEDLVERYDHVAVFRQPDAWLLSERIQAMNAFIDSIVASGAKYNLRDVVTFKKKKRSSSALPNRSASCVLQWNLHACIYREGVLLLLRACGELLRRHRLHRSEHSRPVQVECHIPRRIGTRSDIRNIPWVRFGNPKLFSAEHGRIS